MQDSKKLRFIDRALGSLICFIFSALHKFKIKNDENKFIKKILVIELFEMGAAIMCYPSLNYIKNKLPDADLYCLTLESMKGSWRQLNIIPEQNILVVNENNIFIFLVSLLRQIWQLRKKKIDITIDFELFTRISSIVAFLIKPKYIAGFYKYNFEGLYRGTFHDVKCAFNQNSHISKNFLSLTKCALNLEKKYPNYKGKIKYSELKIPKYVSNRALKEKVQNKIHNKYQQYNNNKIILISPDVGKNLSVRNYPPKYAVEVIKKLLARYPDYLVLLIGVKSNIPISEHIRKHVNDSRCINFCGESSFDELFELMNFSELVISNDNGPAHFAAITRTKTLALFSTDSPYVYGPLGNCVILYSFYQCSPCICAHNNKTSGCRNNLCLQSISPNIVFEYCVKLLENKIEYRTINGTIKYIY